ncbi:hypothetical protein BGX29_008402 [Mortierella sp. GBA35]|nr:hypothetical protein BGX29_008402 [Mortierella sp. GBA35]
MQHTRSLVSLISRGSLSATAPRLITATPYRATTAASLHTTSLSAEEEKRGFLSRLNPFASKTKTETQTTPAQAAKAQEELNVEIQEEEAPIPSWKSDRQALSAEELEASIRSAAAPFVDTAAGTHLNKIQLNDPKIKFQARLLTCY